MFDRLHALLQGWRRIDFRAYLYLCALAGAKVVFLGFRFWICLRVLQVQDSLLLGISFAAVSTIILIVNITPSGIGIRELLIAVLAELLGVGFADGMLAAGLDRVRLRGIFRRAGAAVFANQENGMSRDSLTPPSAFGRRADAEAQSLLCRLIARRSAEKSVPAHRRRL